MLFGSPAGALVNGEEVSDARFADRYPWAAVVVDIFSGGICGGTLIAPRWVLTAAHCTSKGRYVLLGNPRRELARRVMLDDAFRHPGYSVDRLQNDVGLLYLAEAQPPPYAPIATPTQSRLLLRPRAAATILGWGKTATSPEPVERLREARVLLNQLTPVGSQYGFSYTAGPCGRDSGAPMIMQTLVGDWLVVGVASSTDGNLCSKGGGIAFYTNLGAVADFIELHVGGSPAEETD